MADIFQQMDSLFRNEKPEGPVHVFVLHRFLASEQIFAPATAEISRIWDDEMVTEIWRTALPKMRKAPRLVYAGPKKAAASGALVEKIAATHGWTLMEAEEAVALLDQSGQHDSAMAYYGIEPEEKKKK